MLEPDPPRRLSSKTLPQDAAVVTASSRPLPGIRYHLLREERLIYAVPKRFADCSIEELPEHLNFIQFNPSSGIGKLIAEFSRLGSHNKEQEVIVLDSVEAIVECVNEGLGYTLLAEPDINRYANEGVDLRKKDGVDLKRRLVLASRDKNSNLNDVNRLVNLFD